MINNLKLDPSSEIETVLLYVNRIIKVKLTHCQCLCSYLKSNFLKHFAYECALIMLRFLKISFFISFQRQKLVQGANGVEVVVVDGKSDIENGNVPEDKPSEEEDGELTSPFTIPSKRAMEKRKGCDRVWISSMKPSS